MLILNEIHIITKESDDDNRPKNHQIKQKARTARIS